MGSAALHRYLKLRRDREPAGQYVRNKLGKYAIMRICRSRAFSHRFGVCDGLLRCGRIDGINCTSVRGLVRIECAWMCHVAQIEVRPRDAFEIGVAECPRIEVSRALVGG